MIGGACAALLRVAVLGVLPLLLLSLANAPLAAAGAEPALNRLAVACAYDEEFPALRDALLPGAQRVQRTEEKGVTFYRASFGDRELVLYMTGVSMVNAALTTEFAVERFHPDALLFCGIAGAVDPALRPGDVVVPDRWIHQTESVWANPAPGTKQGYALPKIFRPRHGHYGMIWFDDVWVTRSGETTPRQVHAFPADRKLLAAAKTAAVGLDLPAADGRRARVTVGGVGMAGPVFLDNRDFREWAFREWHARIHEMEGTAVAQVAYVNRLPVLVVRGISDLAGGQTDPDQEEKLGRLAAQNAATVTSRLIKTLWGVPFPDRAGALSQNR